jgi:hypothetical protein
MTDVQPILGRRFTSGEATDGVQPVSLLSYSLWQSHFGGDRNVIGKAVVTDQEPLSPAVGGRWFPAGPRP